MTRRPARKTRPSAKKPSIPTGMSTGIERPSLQTNTERMKPVNVGMGTGMGSVQVTSESSNGKTVYQVRDPNRRDVVATYSKRIDALKQAKRYASGQYVTTETGARIYPNRPTLTSAIRDADTLKQSGLQPTVHSSPLGFYASGVKPQSSASQSKVSTNPRTITQLRKNRDATRVREWKTIKDTTDEFNRNKSKPYLTEAVVYKYKTQDSDRYVIREVESYNPATKKSTFEVEIFDKYNNERRFIDSGLTQEQARNKIESFKKDNDTRMPSSMKAIYSINDKIIAEGKLDKDFSSNDIYKTYQRRKKELQLPNYDEKDIKVDIVADSYIGKSKTNLSSASQSKQQRFVSERVQYAFDTSRFETPQKAIAYHQYIIDNNPLTPSELQAQKQIISGIKSKQSSASQSTPLNVGTSLTRDTKFGKEFDKNIEFYNGMSTSKQSAYKKAVNSLARNNLLDGTVTELNSGQIIVERNGKVIYDSYAQRFNSKEDVYDFVDANVNVSNVKPELLQPSTSQTEKRSVPSDKEQSRIVDAELKNLKEKNKLVAPFEKDTWTEKDVKLALRRVNDKKLTPTDIFKANKSLDDGEGVALTQEQQDKGLKYLRNQWKSPTGKERVNNPFREREEAILSDPDAQVWLKDFYPSRSGYYYPVYIVYGAGDSMEYYVEGGKINIVG